MTFYTLRRLFVPASSGKRPRAGGNRVISCRTNILTGAAQGVTALKLDYKSAFELG